MAATGYTPISLYYSSTAAATPVAGNLVNGELAINITDGKLFYKDNTGTVKVIAGTGGTGVVAGSNTQVQYNNNGVFGASANLTFNGTILTANTLNLTNALTTAYGGTGLTSYTAGDLPYYATGTALSKLGIGTSGQILTSSGTAPQWTTLTGVAVTTISFGTTGLTPATATSGAVTVAGTLITSNGGTGLSSYTAGDTTYYASGTTLTKLGIGAANTVYTSSGTAPQWSTSLNLAGSLTVALDSSFTSTGALLISKGTTGQQPGSPVVGMMRYNTSTNQFEGYSGASPAWKSIGGSALSNDTSTASFEYPVFASATTGTAENLYTSNAKYLYKPSTGELQSESFMAGNGIVCNSQTIATSYTLPTGYNGMSAGPVTVNSGVTVTVPSGATWVIA